MRSKALSFAPSPDGVLYFIIFSIISPKAFAIAR